MRASKVFDNKLINELVVAAIVIRARFNNGVVVDRVVSVCSHVHSTENVWVLHRGQLPIIILGLHFSFDPYFFAQLEDRVDSIRVFAKADEAIMRIVQKKEKRDR